MADKISGLGFNLGRRRPQWPFYRGGAVVASRHAPDQLFLRQKGSLQASAPVLTAKKIPELQGVAVLSSWTGSCLVSNERDKRPLPEARKIEVKEACPVCEGERQKYWVWEMEQKEVLHAYAPHRPFLPQQLNIPLSLEHKVNIRDLTLEEFVRALFFARHIIASNQMRRVKGADPVVHIHLGAIGSSIVHPIVVLGLMVEDALYPYQASLDLAARYGRETPSRDILWEENNHVLRGDLKSCFIAKIGGRQDERDEHYADYGWLLHAPYPSLLPYHLRISALDEGAFNLQRLRESQIKQLGYSIWLAVQLLGKLTSEKEEQAINNIAINFNMVPEGAVRAYSKARMQVDVIPQESYNLPGGIEFIGLPVVKDPFLVAEDLRPRVGEVAGKSAEAVLQSLSFDLGGIRQVERIEVLGHRPLVFDTSFDPEKGIHRVSLQSGEVETIARYIWYKPWHGLHTTLVVPEGWVFGPTKISFPSGFTPGKGKVCTVCDPKKLAYPRFEVDIKEGVPITFITNAFGFAGAEEITQAPFEQEVRMLLGPIEKLSVLPAHLLVFAPEHLAKLGEINHLHIRGLLLGWQNAALKIFGKSSINNRLVCLVNLGVEAGASLEHFHSQLIEIPKKVEGNIEKQIAMVDAEGRIGIKKGENPYNLARGLVPPEDKELSRDLMAELLKRIEEKGLVLFEDKNVTAYVEEAPMFPYEVVIRAKRPGASSLTYLKPEELSSFAKAMDIIREVYLKIKVQDLGIIDEAASRDNRETCWRYGIRLMPRRIGDKVKRVGPLDLKGIYLVPVSPEMALGELMQVITEKPQ